MRESPAIPIIGQLLGQGAIVSVFDPAANDTARKLLPTERIRFASGLEAAVSGVDAVLLLTNWEIFRNAPEILARMPKPPLVVDGRRMLDKRHIARYAGIGLSP
jgi:UDP-glucose 6-dehydrogenase